MKIAGAALRALAWIDPTLAARVLARLFLRTHRRPLPEREAAWLQGARRGELPVGAHRLATWTWPAPGPAVLLVHGWEGRGAQLGAFVAPLRDRGFEVVAFDAPGHGASSGGSSSLVALQQAVSAVAEEVRPAAVIAHSAGSVATTLAYHRGLELQRLVYLAPPRRPGSFLHQVGGALGLPGAIVAGAQRDIERRVGVRMDDLERLTNAPALDVPLLVVHDRGDREVPFEEGRGLAADWPGARLHATVGLGHRRLLREPSVVAEVTGFVAALGAGRQLVAAG